MSNDVIGGPPLDPEPIKKGVPEEEAGPKKPEIIDIPDDVAEALPTFVEAVDEATVEPQVDTTVPAAEPKVETIEETVPESPESKVLDPNWVSEIDSIIQGNHPGITPEHAYEQIRQVEQGSDDAKKQELRSKYPQAFEGAGEPANSEILDPKWVSEIDAIIQGNDPDITPEHAYEQIRQVEQGSDDAKKQELRQKYPQAFAEATESESEGEPAVDTGEPADDTTEPAGDTEESEGTPAPEATSQLTPEQWDEAKPQVFAQLRHVLDNYREDSDDRKSVIEKIKEYASAESPLTVAQKREIKNKFPELFTEPTPTPAPAEAVDANPDFTAGVAHLSATINKLKAGNAVSLINQFNREGWQANMKDTIKKVGIAGYLTLIIATFTFSPIAGLVLLGIAVPPTAKRWWEGPDMGNIAKSDARIKLLKGIENTVAELRKDGGLNFLSGTQKTDILNMLNKFKDQPYALDNNPTQTQAAAAPA